MLRQANGSRLQTPTGSRLTTHGTRAQTIQQATQQVRQPGLGHALDVSSQTMSSNTNGAHDAGKSETERYLRKSEDDQASIVPFCDGNLKDSRLSRNLHCVLHDFGARSQAIRFVPAPLTIFAKLPLALSRYYSKSLKHQLRAAAITIYNMCISTGV